MMGVPITFLDKYNPDQFEIVGSSEGDYAPTKIYGPKVHVVDGVRMKSNTGRLLVASNRSGPATYFDVGYPVQAHLQAAVHPAEG